MLRKPRPCVACGRSIRWEAFECIDCRGGEMPRDKESHPYPRGRRPVGKPAIDYAEIDRRLNAGEAYLSIALHADCSYGTVAMRARKLGVARGRNRHAA